MVKKTKLHSYRRNEIVVDSDEPTGNIYCVATGLLRVVVPAIGNGEAITTDFLRKDEFLTGYSLGEDRYRPSVTFITALPSSVYFISVAAMRRLCLKYPEVALGLLDLTAQRTTMFRKQIRRLSSLTSEELVSRVLYELTRLAPTGCGSLDKRITQSVIASYAGLSREAVNRAIRELEQRGLVTRDECGVHMPEEFAPSDFGEMPSA